MKIKKTKNDKSAHTQNNNLLHKCNPHKERLTGRTTEIYTGLSKNGTLLVMESSILHLLDALQWQFWFTYVLLALNDVIIK